MKLRTTFLLLALNAVVFFFLLRQESPFEIREEMGKNEISILPFPMNEATRIDVNGSGIVSPYTMLQENGVWRITSPIEWDANAFAVRRMISRLEAAEVSVRFPVSDVRMRNQTLADFGLENPNFVVSVSYDDDVYEYAFGSPVEINDRLYMLAPGKDEILVVKSNMVQPFLVGLEELRSPNLFSIPVFEIQSLLVEFNDDRSRRRFTNDDSNWVLDTPIFADASDERVEGAIDRLVNFEVDLMPTGTLGDSQQELTHFNAVARFEIIGNRRNSTMLIGQNILAGEVDPLLYRARFEGSDTVFYLPRSEIDWWRNSQASLRERRFFEIDPSTVSKLEVQNTGEESNILRMLKLENNQWRLYAGTEGNVTMVDYQGDGALVVDRIAELNDLLVLAFINDTPSAEDLALYGLDVPKRKVTLESDSGSIELLLGNKSEDGNQVYAKLQEQESVYFVAQEIVSSLTIEPLDYRNRIVPLVETDENVTGFNIVDSKTGHITEATSVESLIETAIQPLDLENAQGIFAAIKTLLKDFTVAGYLNATKEGDEIHLGGVRMPLPFEVQVLTGENQEIAAKFWCSRRFSGTEQVGWIERQQLAIKLNQKLVDYLHFLIYKTEAPEEWAPAEEPATESETGTKAEKMDADPVSVDASPEPDHDDSTENDE